MRNLKLVVLTFLFSISCEKENESIFTGITERDYEGYLVGNVDETDWRFDDVWIEKEENLFDSSNFKTTQGTAESDPNIPDLGEVSSSAVFPNPANSVFNFMINSTADRTNFVLVNRNYDIILAKRQNGGNIHWQINVSDHNKFKVNDIYRIYYKLEYAVDSVERGHGDIKIIN